MKKYIYIIGAILLLLAVGVFAVNSRNDDSMELTAVGSSKMYTTASQETVDEEFKSEEGPKLYIGNPDAKVKIIEFIDYKCPNCNNFHRDVKERIESSYTDEEVAFEIHQTPFIGPDSGRAARGAYCSGGIVGSVFEEYNDAVFDYMYDNYYQQSNFAAEFEDVLTEDVLTTLYLQSGGTNEEKFRNCINDLDTINLYINADQILAAEKEVRGTPSFVIGDTSLVGPQEYSVIKALIEAEL